MKKCEIVSFPGIYIMKIINIYNGGNCFDKIFFAISA